MTFLFRGNEISWGGKESLAKRGNDSHSSYQDNSSNNEGDGGSIRCGIPMKRSGVRLRLRVVEAVAKPPTIAGALIPSWTACAREAWLPHFRAAMAPERRNSAAVPTHTLRKKKHLRG
jgi:hypothetical protein